MTLWAVLFVFGAYLISAPSNVNAETRIEPPSFDGFKTREHRVSFAKELLKYFEKIGTQIPSLHPREEDWVTKERERIKAIPDPAQVFKEHMKLSRTKEYLISIVKDDLAEIEKSLKRIIDKSYLDWEFSASLRASDPTLPPRYRSPDTEEAEIEEWLLFSQTVLYRHPYEELLELNQYSLMPDWGLSIGTYSSLQYKGPATIAGAVNGLVILPYLKAQREKHEKTIQKDAAEVPQKPK